MKHEISVGHEAIANSPKRHAFNEMYFDQIDTEAKAHWLGFILADGCILWNDQTGNYALQVVLQAIDADHLTTLERDLGGLRVPRLEFNSLPSYRAYESAKLTWYSKYLTQRLIDLGIQPRKSGNEGLPIVPAEFTHHLWRGVFDGDGCLVTQVKGLNLVPEYRFSLAGSRLMLESFQAWAQANTGIRPQKIAKARNSRGEAKISVFYMNGNRQIASLMTEMYRDSTRRLERKYLTFLSLLEQNARIRPSYRRAYPKSLLEAVD